MFMDLDLAGGTIRIFGTAFGGLNDPSDKANGSEDFYAPVGDFVGLWGIDFTYSVGVMQHPGDDDIVVFGSGGSGSPNSGTLTRLADPGLGVDQTSYDLVDYAGGHNIDGEPFSFRLGDENNDQGHRLSQHADWPYRTSGWGWVNHTSPDEHIAASDWLFTVGQPVPAPGASLLGLIGLTAILGHRRQARS